MRRSAAPSQLACKRPRFTPPLKSSCNANSGQEANERTYPQSSHVSSKCKFKLSNSQLAVKTAGRCHTSRLVKPSSVLQKIILL